MSKSIVSRRVARLVEAQLGARLLTRSATGAKQPMSGSTYFSRVSEAMAGLEGGARGRSRSLSRT